MNNPTSRTWSPMVSNPDDDFANFLDFGDLNFSAFDTAATTPVIGNALQQDGGNAMDTSIARSDALLALEQGQLQHQHQTGLSVQMAAMNSYQEPYNLEAELLNQQRQRQVQMQSQRYHGPSIIPPTPNSIEMHGGQPQYYQPRMDQQQLQMYEHYRRHQKDQMNFTPLVSPAVTPLDTQFRYPDYDASTEAFSPLTSPALRAQSQAAQHSVYGTVRGSDTSDTTSPVDLSLEYNGPTSGSTPGSLRKSRRKVSTSSTKNPARAVRQSPAMKPQGRKKQPSSTVIPPKEVAGIIEQARRKQEAGSIPTASDGKTALYSSQDSSGADSVSPEPLSEILMPPPATPRSNSAGRSPYLGAKQAGPPAIADQTGEPATPASLMQLRRQAEKATAGQRQSSHLKKQATLAEADMEQIMEDIALPEPAANATKKPVLQSIDTAQANKDRTMPAVSARRKAHHGPVSAPVTASGSTFPSPQTSAMASPTGTISSKRGDPKGKAQDLRKRSSTHSGKESPALRPRISPSIKPLLPEGVVSAETSALLLASKSNYQNILEGTHFPGVSYPETLSTNLTSKRTSHKIAEQGRRNRINTALQEIASLLPPQPPPPLVNGSNGTGENGGGMTNAAMMTTGTAQQQSNSKASTVEAAIDYIKSLQKEVRKCRDKITQFEKVTEQPGEPMDAEGAITTAKVKS